MSEAHGKAYEIFKKTREERQLSLPDVANALHLTVTMIEQIEAGELVHRHLAPVFMRGYVRSYAKYLNLPESIVDEMISPLSVENPVKVGEKSKTTYATPEKKPLKKQPSLPHSKKALTYLLVVAVLIIIASFWHGTNKPDANEQPAPVIEQSEDATPEPMTEDMAVSQTEESSEESSETSLPVSTEETAPVTESTPPAVVETPAPAPVVVTPPPAPVKKAPTPPKAPVVPTTESGPEVVDAQETP